MAVRSGEPRTTGWRTSQTMWGPFDGGLNLRDSYIAVAQNELIDGLNLTMDENGILVKRNSSPSSASFPAPPGTVVSSFYSRALSLGIIQVGTTVYKCALGGGSWTSFDTLTNSTPAQYVDFVGKLVYAADANGVRVYDGATAVSPSGSAAGYSIAVWQNKVWVAGIATGTTRARLFWSNAGDPLIFTSATDFVDVREKDDEAIVGLFASSGLLVFKEDSWYRVNDSTTGSYQTVDWATGTVSKKAITAAEGRIYYWGRDGIYATNGTSPGVSISDKVRPLFQNTFINATTKPLIAATATNNRIYFYFPRASSTTNDEILEFNPRQGWFMEADGGGAVTSPFKYLNSSGIEIVSHFVGSTVKDLYTSTTRTGYSFSMQTGWVEPFGGLYTRMHSIDLTIQPAAATYTVNIPYITMNDTGTTNPTYSKSVTWATGFQTRKYQPLLKGRAFQLAITDSGSANFRLFNARLNHVLAEMGYS